MPTVCFTRVQREHLAAIFQLLKDNKDRKEVRPSHWSFFQEQLLRLDTQIIRVEKPQVVFMSEDSTVCVQRSQPINYV